MAIILEYTAEQWKQEDKNQLRCRLDAYFKELIEDNKTVKNILDYVELQDVEQGVENPLSEVKINDSQMEKELIEIALGTWYHRCRANEPQRKASSSKKFEHTQEEIATDMGEFAIDYHNSQEAMILRHFCILMEHRNPTLACKIREEIHALKHMEVAEELRHRENDELDLMKLQKGMVMEIWFHMLLNQMILSLDIVKPKTRASENEENLIDNYVDPKWEYLMDFVLHVEVSKARSMSLDGKQGALDNVRKHLKQHGEGLNDDTLRHMQELIDVLASPNTKIIEKVVVEPHKETHENGIGYMYSCPNCDAFISCGCAATEMKECLICHADFDWGKLGEQ